MKTGGFTLLELLGIIVLLAVIALIAVPIIAKIVDQTEDSAAKRSAELYIDSVNQTIARENLKNKFRPKKCVIQEDGNLICDGNKELKIETTGSRPIKGILIIEDRKVVSISGMLLKPYQFIMDANGKIVLDKFVEDVCKATTFVSSPKLYNNLAPVIYENGNWKIADASSKWYNYDNQEWANAVILKSGVTKNIGDVVDVSNEVQGMFVWIPRYEYKIDGQYGTHMDKTQGTAELPGEIEVNFISVDQLEPSCKDYRIHSAFRFGTTELTGIWIGKFETTGTATAPTILPNLASLRGQNISKQFSTAQKFKTYMNDSSVDSHMAKNSEWGVAAYLSQSRYGKYGNENYKGINKEVYQNGSNSFITGNSNGTTGLPSPKVQCVYNDIVNRGSGKGACGAGASTTGNITGVYDMVGGSYETVMSNYNNILGESGFSTLPDKRYYDSYITTDVTTACNGVCYGHALSETDGWYFDNNHFVISSSPWLDRGGSYENEVDVGVFRLYYSTGSGGSYYSFRVVLTDF